MPVRRAIRDSFGVKDVVMDTLDTLRGSGFSYRSFEPSEGVPHMGSSRTSRIMAGLRYSNMTAKKHWLEPAPTSRFLNSSRGMNEENIQDNDSEPLEFEDPDPNDEMEILFAASRKMVFGDYNYPVIDFRVPLWRQARQERRLQRYGGISQTSRYDDRKINKINNDEERLLGTREGCIDVIIKQGKDNYVVVDEMSDEEVHLITKPPLTPIRKPTLSNKHRNPSSSASTPTVNNIPSSSKQLVQPSFSTPSNQLVQPSFSSEPRYPQPPQAPTSLPPPISYHNPSNSQQITVSPSEDDAPQWQWPDQFSNTNHSSYTDNDDDLLSGDVWK